MAAEEWTLGWSEDGPMKCPSISPEPILPPYRGRPWPGGSSQPRETRWRVYGSTLEVTSRVSLPLKELQIETERRKSRFILTPQTRAGWKGRSGTRARGVSTRTYNETAGDIVLK